MDDATTAQGQWDSWGSQNASRSVRKFQSRRSPLVWKLHGQCLDGFSNDHPPEDKPGSGWMMDDQRPTLTLNAPPPGRNAELSRVVVGMHDSGSGLVAESFRVTARRRRSTASRPARTSLRGSRRRRRACASGSCPSPSRT